jgi:tetratricopeptide (TPR) repeat protein
MRFGWILGAYTSRYWRRQNSCESRGEPARSIVGYNISFHQNARFGKSEKTMKNTNYRSLRAAVKMRQFLTAFATLSAFFFFFGCTTMRQNTRDPESDRSDQFVLAKLLFKEGYYEAAMKENQKLLSEGKAPGDMALYNIGLISACSFNPKKDYLQALDTFKKLVSQYPHSSFAEEAKVWIQVLEEHQKIAGERQKFLEEKRNLTREREILSQEREKLKYTVEKSRQLDIEIEKRRRQTQSR